MIPHERSLVKRLEGKPFALIGVNTDANREEVKSRSRQDQVTWRSFFDGRSNRITGAWSINSFPSIFVIDHKGVIRFTNVRGEAMDRAVDKLLAEVEKETQ